MTTGSQNSPDLRKGETFKVSSNQESGVWDSFVQELWASTRKITAPDTSVVAAENAVAQDIQKPTGVASDSVDTPPNLEANIKKLTEKVKVADETDTRRNFLRVLEGQSTSLNLIEMLFKPGLGTEKHEALSEMNQRVNAEKWENYQHYLEPALARVQLALVKIGSGNDLLIAEGEKSLIAAIELRPELQLHADFQKQVSATYRQMETIRASQEKPAWRGKLACRQEPSERSVPEKNGLEAIDAAMEKANKAFRESGAKESREYFEKAIELADSQPKEYLKSNLTALFCRRLTVERAVIAKDVRGESSDILSVELKKAREEEWQSYREFLSSGTTRANAGLAMISSGEPNLMRLGKIYLCSAITLRHELEFDSDYQSNVNKSFQNYYSANKQDSEPRTTDNSNQAKPDLRQFDVGYKPIEIKQFTPEQLAEIQTDKEVKSYTVDNITGPVLTAALLYLGYRVVKNQIQRIRNSGTKIGADNTDSITSDPEVKPDQGDRPTTPKDTDNPDNKTVVPEGETQKKSEKTDLHSNDSDRHKSALDKKIKELCKEIRSNPTPEKIKEVETLVIADAKIRAKRMGLPEALITPEFIKINAFSNMGENKAMVNLKAFRIELWVPHTDSPTASIEHELDHVELMIKRTALKMADEKAFNEVTLESSSRHFGCSLGLPPLSEHGKELVRRFAIKYLEQNPDPKTSDKELLSSRGGSKALWCRFRIELARQSTDEIKALHDHFFQSIEHYRQVQKIYCIPPTALSNNKTLHDCVVKEAKRLEALKPKYGGSLKTNHEMVKVFSGVSADVLGMSDHAVYFGGSGIEMSARRAQKTANLRDYLKQGEVITPTKGWLIPEFFRSIKQYLFGAPEQPPIPIIDAEKKREMIDDIKRESDLHRIAIELSKSKTADGDSNKAAHVDKACEYAKRIVEAMKPDAANPNSERNFEMQMQVDYFRRHELVAVDSIPVQFRTSAERREYYKNLEQSKLKDVPPQQETLFARGAKPKDPIKDEVDKFLDRIDELTNKGATKELIEFLKTQNNRAAIRIFLTSDLPAMDPGSLHLRHLAGDSSTAGIIALDIALTAGIKELKPVLEQRIKNGSITREILNGNFALWKLDHTQAKGEELLNQLLEPVKNDPIRRQQLLRLLANVDFKPNAKECISEAAVKEILKLPKAVAQQELFTISREGNPKAAEAWDKLVKDHEDYRREHETRKTIPDQAILDFHQATKIIADKFGLSDQEYDHHSKVHKNMNTLRSDLLAKLCHSTLFKVSGDQALRSEMFHAVMGNEPIDLAKLKQALSQNPELYERFEAAAKDYEAWTSTKMKIEKIGLELQPEVAKLAKAAGLPPIKSFKLGALPKDHGSYGGLGDIIINQDYAKSSKLSSPEFANTVVHETAHFEQDISCIRYLMEEHGITKGKPISASQLKAIQADYKVIYHSQITREFLESIHEKTNGEKLTPAESFRAQRLLVSLAQDRCDSERDTIIKFGQKLLTISNDIKKAENIETLREYWGDDKNFERCGEKLKMLCGKDADSKNLIESFDKMKLLSDKNIEFDSIEFQEARANFRQAVIDIIDVLNEKAHDLYINKFHERDTYAEGDRAEALIRAKIGDTTSGPKTTTGDRDIEIVRSAPDSFRRARTLMPALIVASDTFNRSFDTPDLKVDAKRFENSFVKLFINNNPGLKNDPLLSNLKIVGSDQTSKQARLRFFDITNGVEVLPLHRERIQTGDCIVLEDGSKIPVDRIRLQVDFPEELFNNANSKDPATRRAAFIELESQFGSMLSQLDNLETRKQRTKYEIDRFANKRPVNMDKAMKQMKTLDETSSWKQSNDFKRKLSDHTEARLKNKPPAPNQLQYSSLTKAPEKGDAKVYATMEGGHLKLVDPTRPETRKTLDEKAGLKEVFSEKLFSARRKAIEEIKDNKARKAALDELEKQERLFQTDPKFQKKLIEKAKEGSTKLCEKMMATAKRGALPVIKATGYAFSVVIVGNWVLDQFDGEGNEKPHQTEMPFPTDAASTLRDTQNGYYYSAEKSDEEPKHNEASQPVADQAVIEDKLATFKLVFKPELRKKLEAALLEPENLKPGKALEPLRKELMESIKAGHLRPQVSKLLDILFTTGTLDEAQMKELKLEVSKGIFRPDVGNGIIRNLAQKRVATP